jgi:hypothetical protein
VLIFDASNAFGFPPTEKATESKDDDPLSTCVLSVSSKSTESRLSSGPASAKEEQEKARKRPRKSRRNPMSKAYGKSRVKQVTSTPAKIIRKKALSFPGTAHYSRVYTVACDRFSLALADESLSTMR